MIKVKKLFSNIYSSSNTIFNTVYVTIKYNKVKNVTKVFEFEEVAYNHRLDELLLILWYDNQIKGTIVQDKIKTITDNAQVNDQNEFTKAGKFFFVF